MVFTGFRDGNDYCFAPRWRKTARLPDVVIYVLLREQIKQNLGGVLKVGSGPVAELLALCNDSFNSVIEKGRLYSSSFVEEKFGRFLFVCLFVC